MTEQLKKTSFKDVLGLVGTSVKEIPAAEAMVMLSRHIDAGIMDVRSGYYCLKNFSDGSEGTISFQETVDHSIPVIKMTYKPNNDSNNGVLSQYINLHSGQPVMRAN